MFAKLLKIPRYSKCLPEEDLPCTSKYGQLHKRLNPFCIYGLSDNLLNNSHSLT